eukprot:COSAG01_NODE_5892_length_3966_cov_2.409514_3_plen_35_part_00
MRVMREEAIGKRRSLGRERSNRERGAREACDVGE